MRTNPLGNVRAELDHSMLDSAFYAMPEYRSLLEEHARRVVVGRRGTGKSALFYMLQRHWLSAEKTSVLALTPTETEVIGLRHFVEYFGSKHAHLRAACNLAWQYALLHEILVQLGGHYKVRSDADLHQTGDLVRRWRRRGDTITSRLFNALEEHVSLDFPVEKRLATLSQSLKIGELQGIVQKVLDASKYTLRIVADRLDDGYEPDTTGVAILTGLIYAFDTLSSALPHIATTVFLRDNIFRAIQLHDPDYSRNIEGDVLRLHWDAYHLFNMICQRIRIAFSVTQEKNLRVWECVTARELQGMDGFRRCLRLTLYRPRDLLVLVNSAFNYAQSHDRNTIVNDDVDASAREISCSRLDDLKKEYREIMPGIDHLVSMFAGGMPELSLSGIEALLAPLRTATELSQAEAQTLAIMGSPETVVHSLFSIGFLGVWKATASTFVFCHDGKDPDFAVNGSSRLLVHPCYWIALNLREEELSVADAECIHDEYDIEVSSETPEIRKRKLGRFIGQLALIPEGDTGAARFEDWCLEAVRIVFATGLVNAELHPNRNATQRRDVVGRNTGKTETWARILTDHASRQVIFEIKNYSTELGSTEYRQMLSYLCGEHGRLGFIINRCRDAHLQKGSELQWVREMYHEHDHRVIVKLPADLIVNWLSKLRSPQKHDAPDKGLGSLLDTYERMYLRLGGTGGTVKRKRR